KHGFFRIDYDDPKIDWQLADDDVELAPGVTAVMTPGHTPGHQSFVIDLDDTAAEAYGATGFVLAFDAADLQRNIDEELSPGGMVDTTPAQGIESIRRLKSIAAERDYQLVPGHDPLAWPAFTKQLGVPGP
ncbi:MAG: N-acyl homoserine lactone hydrolase, partial [Frankiales bacterium]|nr:N-acyl homoserine lactone hydrolase [Frankiales bacterium]